MRVDIAITNIPTIMGIMGVMAMVITHPLDLATVTAEAIMAAGLEAFTVVIDKNGNIDE